jgi:large subunit ribosomal protein L29
MKAKEIRGMRSDERQGELEKLEKELFNLRTRAETEKLENTHLLGDMRRDIARFKTIIKQTQLKGEK